MYNIIHPIIICQCTSPDIHTKFTIVIYHDPDRDAGFKDIKKYQNYSLLCVWHFRTMVWPIITLDWSQCIHFFLFWSSWLLWLISCALHWHWGNLGMGRPWLDRGWGRPWSAHPTHQWHGQWAASYNEIRLPLQKLLVNPTKHFWILDQLNKSLVDVCWRALLFVYLLYGASYSSIQW